jgi:hypothetical protein
VQPAAHPAGKVAGGAFGLLRGLRHRVGVELLVLWLSIAEYGGLKPSAQG